jgi:hypothetical protein
VRRKHDHAPVVELHRADRVLAGLGAEHDVRRRIGMESERYLAHLGRGLGEARQQADGGRAQRLGLGQTAQVDMHSAYAELARAGILGRGRLDSSQACLLGAEPGIAEADERLAPGGARR